MGIFFNANPLLLLSLSVNCTRGDAEVDHTVYSAAGWWQWGRKECDDEYDADDRGDEINGKNDEGVNSKMMTGMMMAILEAVINENSNNNDANGNDDYYSALVAP